MVPKGETWWGRGDWGAGTHIYAPDSLEDGRVTGTSCATQESPQSGLLTYVGKEPEQEWTRVRASLVHPACA